MKKLLFLLLSLSLLTLPACESVDSVNNSEPKNEPKQEIEVDKHSDGAKDDNEFKKDAEITEQSPEHIVASVTRVVDGDTIVVNMDGKEEKVRMILVDTPETVHPSKPVEPFGPEASEFTKETLDGQQIGLEIGVQERDKYGRLLAYVWLGDKMFNKLLLEKGLARVSVYPPNTKYVDEFKEIEAQAKDKSIGIWSIEDYTHDDLNKSTADSHSSSLSSSNISSNNAKAEQGSSPANREDCNIKGNISSSGEKIYHIPGGTYYDRTNPEEWFCSKEEAEAAGYRASMR